MRITQRCRPSISTCGGQIQQAQGRIGHLYRFNARATVSALAQWSIPVLTQRIKAVYNVLTLLDIVKLFISKQNIHTPPFIVLSMIEGLPPAAQ